MSCSRSSLVLYFISSPTHTRTHTSLSKTFSVRWFRTVGASPSWLLLLWQMKWEVIKESLNPCGFVLSCWCDSSKLKAALTYMFFQWVNRWGFSALLNGTFAGLGVCSCDLLAAGLYRDTQCLFVFSYTPAPPPVYLNTHKLTLGWDKQMHT